jgi:NADH dehydrogenase
VHREHFEPGEKVFDSGDVGDKVYFIAKGEAVVMKDSAVLATLGQGEMFGETALVCNRERNATVRAQTALDLVVVNREAFHELLGNLPGMSDTIQGIMSKRTGRTVDLCREVTGAMADKARM